MHVKTRETELATGKSMHIKYLIALALVSHLSACTTPNIRTKTAAAPLWRHTDPELAYAQAEKEKKPIFIYWGAIWCPPCNELKSNLFTNPQFAELLGSVISVYLDGDSEIAQMYSDKLKVSSYPTMLLLDPSGKEIARIIEPVGIEEFELFFRSALLAHAQPPLQRERSVLLLKTIGESLDNNEGAKADKDKSWAIDVLLNFLDDNAHPLPSFFSLRAKDTKNWLGKATFEEKLEKKWLDRSSKATAEPERPITSRLWFHLPELELTSSQQPIDRKVQAQTQIVELLSQTPNHYERHAATSAAATLLPMLGYTDLARTLLVKALQEPEENTPWYLEATLAELEATRGNVQEALRWSARAKKSAKGLATTIQWDAMNILLNLKYARESKANMLTLLNDFYDELFRRTDGFSGRNRIYATKIAKALKPERARYQPVISIFSARCRTLKGDSKSNCDQYFAQLN